MSNLRFVPGYYEWNIWGGVSDKEPLFTFGDLSEDLAGITNQEELIALCQHLIEVWKEDWEENNKPFDFSNEEISALVENMADVLNSHYGFFSSWSEFGGFEPENRGYMCNYCGYKTRFKEEVCPNCNAIMINL